MGGKSLERLASAVGKPVRTDECTVQQTKVAYARVLVDVDIR